MPERVPLEGWETYHGHIRRYQYAAERVYAGEYVNDVACGVGYGATFFLQAGSYRGYDRPGVPSQQFPAAFYAADLDDPGWEPHPADVTLCFETLEHVADPLRLARVLAASTSRAVFVSVPVVATMHANQFHRSDFTQGDIPPMFAEFAVADEWAQPDEDSHVWMFERP
jgi:hypothetical protein